MTGIRGGRRKRVHNLLFNGCIRVVAADDVQVSERVLLAFQRALRLRGPEKYVFSKQCVALGLCEPRKGLRRSVFLIIVIAEREGCARPPSVGGMFRGKSGKLFVSTWRGVMQIARESG